MRTRSHPERTAAHEALEPENADGLASWHDVRRFGMAVEHVAAGRGNFAKLSTSSNTVDLPADLI